MTLDPSTPAPAGPLPPGATAPDFDLPVAPGAKGERLRLGDLRGRPVVLAFYPFDWSPTCSDQLAVYNEIMEEFERFGAALLGVSVDSVWCHAAFAEHRGLRMRLLADFEPKGQVARAYGVYRADGMSERAIFVIDGEGVIRWAHVSPIGVNPGADGILQALEALDPVEATR